MNKRQRRWAIASLAAAVVAASAFFLAASGIAFEINSEWVETAAAQARTRAGDCPQAGERCWELCFNGNPTGNFACYSTPPPPNNSSGPTIPGHP